MKKIFALLLTMLFATSSFAWNDSIVRWRRIVGVITAPGVQNPVAMIPSGGLPWTVSEGRAVVNLATGDTAFFVKGLVLVGGNASGTPDGVTSVKGTLVCNPGSTTDQAVIDTATVPLDAQGDAEFKGSLQSVPPATCANPLFLIRTASGAWIATRAVHVRAQ
jgi:hypothetical protein